MIEVKNLKFSYHHDGTYQVDDISFSIKAGETFGFLGPNGAGKSTTQKILIGLLPMQEGEAEVCETNVREYNPSFFNKIGVSFEFPNAYKRLTALENLKYYATLFDGPTEDPLKLLALVGLEESANKKVSDFSKGMLQRLTMARSMLNQSEVWFLDEPLSGLDPQTALKIKQVIKEEKTKGRTIFLTTHDMNVADELCDRVAFMNQGKLVAVDSPRNLKLRYGEKIMTIEYVEEGQTKRQVFDLNGQADEIAAFLNNHQVETVHSGEATLNDIFIEITGRGLN